MSVSVRYLYACQCSSNACWKEDVDECDWMEFGSVFQRRAEWKKKDRVQRVERVVGWRTWSLLLRLWLLSLANGAGRHEDATGVGEFFMRWNRVREAIARRHRNEGHCSAARSSFFGVVRSACRMVLVILTCRRSRLWAAEAAAGVALYLECDSWVVLLWMLSWWNFNFVIAARDTKRRSKAFDFKRWAQRWTLYFDEHLYAKSMLIPEFKSKRSSCWLAQACKCLVALCISTEKGVVVRH